MMAPIYLISRKEYQNIYPNGHQGQFQIISYVSVMLSHSEP